MQLHRGRSGNIIASGVYDQIIAKWDLHLLKLPEPGINLAK